MSYLKNAHMLKGLLSEEDLQKMEYAANEHKRMSNITFKITGINDQRVIFQVSQARSSSGVYFPAKRLIEITKETFGRFFPNLRIDAGPIPYQEPECNQVTAEWLTKQMKKHNVRLIRIADDTGMAYANLSAKISSDTITQPIKAMLWYYFKSLEAAQ